MDAGQAEKRVTVVACPRAEHTAALELMFQGMDEPARSEQVAVILDRIPKGGDGGNLVFVVREGTKLAGCVLWLPLAGRMASIWAPQVAPAQPESTADALLERALAEARARGAHLAQSLLDPQDQAAAGRLRRGGFAHMTDILYLFGDTSGPATPAKCDLDFLQIASPAEKRLASIVESTYEGTLDCPQLNGIRSIDDVLAGYCDGGDPSSPGWWIVRHRGESVGCLLLNDHATSDQVELVYMGIVPRFRGRGWGLAIVRQAQQLARQCGRARLVLAVDARNRPAISHYAACGFAAWDRRAVFLRVFSEENANN